MISTMDCFANKIFTSKYNPLYYTGQLAIVFLILTAISGIYMLPFYSINAEKAYESVNQITDQPIGGLMRSIHRYSSDALIAVLVLHGIRYALTKRFTHNRCLIWVSGVILFLLILVEGITGYWMVWDERAKMVAILTTELLDQLKIFPKPLARSFFTEEGTTNLLFFAVIFLHIAGALILALFIIIHFSRFSETRVFPPKKLVFAATAFVLILSVLKPAKSSSPALLTAVPSNIPVDWFYMFLLPLMAKGYGWYGIAFLLSALLLPWIFRGKKMTAEVIEENCVGCGLCHNDCPYNAINMEGREKVVAKVNGKRCSGCGTCLGSCMYNAIKIGDVTLEKLKEEVGKKVRDGKVGFACKHAYRNDDFINLNCIGMLNPSLLSHALSIASSAVIIGCKFGDCYHRLGNERLKERLKGKRAPEFNRQDRIEVHWITPGKGLKNNEFKKSMIPVAALVILLTSLSIIYFSENPAYSVLDEDEGIILFTMRAFGELVEPCPELTPELIQEGFVCKSERFPVKVVMSIDGKEVLSKEYKPTGIRNDGPSYAYEKFKVKSGKHEILIMVRKGGELDYTFNTTLELKGGKMIVINFENENFYILK